MEQEEAAPQGAVLTDQESILVRDERIIAIAMEHGYMGSPSLLRLVRAVLADIRQDAGPAAH